MAEIVCAIALLILLLVLKAIEAHSIQLGCRTPAITADRNNCGKSNIMEVKYVPPRAAMCGKQLRKFGETLCKKNEGTEMFPRSFGKRVFFVYVYGYVVTNPFFQFVGTDT